MWARVVSYNRTMKVLILNTEAVGSGEPLAPQVNPSALAVNNPS